MPVSKVRKKKSSKKPPAFTITAKNGNKLTLPRAPRVTEFSNIGQEWTESSRAGRESVMRRTATKSREFNITIQLGVRDITKTVTYQLKNLEDWSSTIHPVKVNYTMRETGHYYITDFSYTITERRPTDNEPTRAEATLTFRKAVSDTIKVGALKKPKKKHKPVKKKAKPKPKPKKKKVRTYKMKKGDTLWDLARKFYGNSNKWKKLADANKIKNVRRIPIGKVIKIP